MVTVSSRTVPEAVVVSVTDRVRFPSGASFTPMRYQRSLERGSSRSEAPPRNAEDSTPYRPAAFTWTPSPFAFDTMEPASRTTPSAFVASRFTLRITSYNVCYTKLLRGDFSNTGITGPFPSASSA